MHGAVYFLSKTYVDFQRIPAWQDAKIAKRNSAAKPHSAYNKQENMQPKTRTAVAEYFNSAGDSRIKFSPISSPFERNFT